MAEIWEAFIPMHDSLTEDAMAKQGDAEELEESYEDGYHKNDSKTTE